MRVITGSARGRRLNVLPGEDVTRPTSERVKEGVFSAIQFDIEGRAVLDLFAGSGQMAIEALSRGASYATLVDADAKACEIIRGNLEHTGFQNARVIKSDYAAFLSGTGENFGLIFLDPPYNSGLLEKAAAACVRLLNVGGLVICEHSKDYQMPGIDGLNLIKSLRYGRTSVSIFRKAD